jgi:hypothetical protein
MSNQTDLILQRKRQPFAVQSQQTTAAISIRQRKLDGLIYSPWTCCNRPFNDLRTVGSEQKDHFGIRSQAVHLVEHLMQRDLVGRMTLFITLRHYQINIFQYDQSRRNHPGELTALFNQSQLLPAHHDYRCPLKRLPQPFRRISFTCTRLAMQQNAALYRSSTAAQSLGVLQKSKLCCAPKTS